MKIARLDPEGVDNAVAGVQAIWSLKLAALGASACFDSLTVERQGSAIVAVHFD